MALLGGALYWLSRRTLNKITYSAGSLRIHKITLSGIEFRIKMTVLNQSDIPAPVSAFLGQLLYMKPGAAPAVIGQLQLVNPVDLPGFGQADLEFSMKSGLFGTAFELINILTNGDPTNFNAIKYENIDWRQFAIVGTLKVGPAPITVNTRLVN